MLVHERSDVPTVGMGLVGQGLGVAPVKWEAAGSVPCGCSIRIHIRTRIPGVPWVDLVEQGLGLAPLKWEAASSVPA